jgi:hypothetical protein
LTLVDTATIVPDVASENPVQQLAAIILGRPLAQYVATKRSQGMGWRRLADALRTDTAGRISVSHETLRSWFPDAERKVAS